MFGIDDAVTAGATLITTIINKVAPDADLEEKNRIAEALAIMNNEHEIALAQIEVNKVEAQSPNIFVAGYRPAYGWIGAFGLAYQLVIAPICNGVLTLFSLPPAFVSIDISLLQTVIGGLLGLFTARSYEKKYNVDTKQIG